MSSSPPPSAATSAGASPPIMAVTTVARKNSTTSVDRSTDSRSSTPMTVAITGRITAAGQPNAWRRAGRDIRRRGADPASSWVTRWTSMLPDSAVVRTPIPGSNARAHRERREVPSTNWVAFAARAKSSSAAGTSSPTTVWNDAPTSSARRRSSTPVLPGSPGPVSPSLRRTSTHSRSADPARRAMRAARRMTVALSGPPVTATTTRSRASQTSEIASWLR